MNQPRTDAFSRSEEGRHFSGDDPASVKAERRYPTLEKLATLAVLLTGLALTAFVFKLVNDTHYQRALDRFEQGATDGVNSLSATLRQHTNLILAMQGLFHASDYVSRTDFRKFVDTLDAGKLFPGTSGLSWNKLVSADEIAAFEAEVRSDDSLVEGGYPDFTVRPVVAGDDAVVVKYIEPMQGNENAFGFNSAANPARFSAVEEARDTGALTLSSPITLVQEKGSQKGYLMMLPTYRPVSPTTLSERRAAFNGLAVLVFRVGDLIEASRMPEFTYVQVNDVTGGVEPSVEQAIHISGQLQNDAEFLQATRNITIGNRSWVLMFQESLEQRGFGERWIEVVIACLGILVSLLAASLYGSLASSRERALAQAQTLTVGLHEANEELSRSNADLSQFAHVASHDLQTPVRNVISAVTLLEEHLGDDIDSETEEYLGFLRKSSDRMRTLVSDLLEYARLGRDAITFEPVELDSILNEVRETTSELCSSSGTQLQVGPLPCIVGDARQLQRVFENLVTNAIKYAEKDRPPRIVIEHRQAQQAIQQRHDSSTTDFIELTVSDNGQGIEETFRDTVFLPFRRLHRHDEIPGSGLGLGICKQIVERHGGSLSIESSSDQGTTFLITLPDRPHVHAST